MRSISDEMKREKQSNWKRSLWFGRTVMIKCNNAKVAKQKRKEEEEQTEQVLVVKVNLHEETVGF
jgi:hypothetical protein